MCVGHESHAHLLFLGANIRAESAIPRVLVVFMNQAFSHPDLLAAQCHQQNSPHHPSVTGQRELLEDPSAFRVALKCLVAIPRHSSQSLVTNLVLQESPG